MAITKAEIDSAVQAAASSGTLEAPAEAKLVEHLGRGQLAAKSREDILLEDAKAIADADPSTWTAQDANTLAAARKLLEARERQAAAAAEKAEESAVRAARLAAEQAAEQKAIELEAEREAERAEIEARRLASAGR